ncbi:MAG: hypothetical protein Q9167_007640 [Letrouitia subvulpina]
MISPRSLYTAPPPAKDAAQNNPTLLVSWWCTGFALAIILVRVSGRYIRTEKLFREDKIMAWSVIPLLGRMALVHMILIWGTNNAAITDMPRLNLDHREIGSKLVLVSRIILWIAKFTISEFLKRLTSQVWRTKYELGLQFIRWFLIVTFVAVVIATLSECQPFSHYWQVVPDPGAKCRQGYAQLITMGASDVITDLLLVCFPIPIVLKSNMPLKRKISLVLLFCLSLILIGITIYRVIGVIDRHSDQQFRSLLASVEVLAAAAVSNALVLGSFVRDRGAKKQRYRFGSVGGNSSLDRAGTNARPRVLTMQTWGSDADLVSELGIRLNPELESQRSAVPRPAPIALPSASHAKAVTPDVSKSDWTFPSRPSVETDATDLKDTFVPDRNLEKPPLSPGEVDIVTPRRMSFFDVGGLLEDEGGEFVKQRQTELSIPEDDITPSTVGGPFHAPAVDSLSSPETRRGSQAFLSDIGGLLSRQPVLQPAPLTRDFSRPTSSMPPPPPQILESCESSEPTTSPQFRRSSLQPRPSSCSTSEDPPQDGHESTLHDVGGLLE